MRNTKSLAHSKDWIVGDIIILFLVIINGLVICDDYKTWYSGQLTVSKYGFITVKSNM